MGKTRTLWACHLPAEGMCQCPVLDCPLGCEGKRAASQQALCLHFSHRHPNDLVGVGGNLFSRCERCGVQTRDADSACHESTASCRSRAERRDRHAVAARCAAATEQEFTAYQKPMRRVEIPEYLERLIAYDDTDVPPHGGRSPTPTRCGGAYGSRSRRRE